MQKRFYYELMGIAALAILGTLLLVVAVCFSYMNPEYLSGQQQEKMILVLMIGIAAIMAFCFLLAGIWSHQLGEKIHLGKEEDNELNAKLRQEFTANVSHELKTPLTAISGYAELIENGMISSDDEIRRMAGEIHNNSGRLITLINDVIRLSELDEERDEILEKVPLSVVAQSSVKMLQINAEKHHVTLTFEGEDAFIWGTRQMVDEVVYNLCDNAIRYNKENGSVTVRVYREHEALCHDLDHMAGVLQPFCDRHIPILWRPFHESEGEWFWWGAKGPEVAAELFRFMFRYYTQHHHLDNLIWVWNSPLPEGYVGDEYCDIISRDLYTEPHVHGAYEEQYEELLKVTKQDKGAALGETGILPDPEALMEKKVPWLWYMTWSFDFALNEKFNSDAALKKLYESSYAIDLDKFRKRRR